jgi:tellurite resistance protein
MISPHDALIYVMVMVSAVDRHMGQPEFAQIGRIVQQFPVFKDFDAENLPRTAQECAVMLNAKDGVDHALDQIAKSLPAHLRETAYVMACEVAAIDQHMPLMEMRLLQRLRGALTLDRLVSAAIERATVARMQKL